MAKEMFGPSADILSDTNVIVSYAKIDRLYSELKPMALPAMAVAALKFAIEAYGALSTISWQNNVSDKLEEISQKLDQIIAELQRLRKYIDERLTQETMSIFHGEVDARRRTVEGILAGIGDFTTPLDDETRRRLIRIMDELDVPLWQLMNYTKFSFDPFPAVVSGVITKLLILKMVGGSDGERRNFIQKIVQVYFAPALDPTIPISIEASRNSSANEAISKSADFDSLTNKWWTIWLDIDKNFAFSTQSMASGSFNGVSFAHRSQFSLGKPYPPLRGGTLDWSPEHFENDINQKRLSVLAAISRELDLRQKCLELREINDLLLMYADNSTDDSLIREK